MRIQVTKSKDGKERDQTHTSAYLTDFGLYLFENERTQAVYFKSQSRFMHTYVTVTYATKDEMRLRKV